MWNEVRPPAQTGSHPASPKRGAFQRPAISWVNLLFCVEKTQSPEETIFGGTALHRQSATHLSAEIPARLTLRLGGPGPNQRQQSAYHAHERQNKNGIQNRLDVPLAPGLPSGIVIAFNPMQKF
jgi:hypothetical protein